jgi:DNA-binding transcriptional ArsR family regulator
MKRNKDATKLIPVTPEQAKLLESSLRIRIMHALADEPRTSKQVALLLGSTPGNVHYHIRKLYDGGLLELAHTQAAGGVVEKYYRSLGTAFQSRELQGYEYLPGEAPRQLKTSLSLSENDLEEFLAQLKDLLTEWEIKGTKGQEYGIGITVGRVNTALSAEADGESN